MKVAKTPTCKIRTLEAVLAPGKAGSVRLGIQQGKEYATLEYLIINKALLSITRNVCFYTPGGRKKAITHTSHITACKDVKKKETH